MREDINFSENLAYYRTKAGLKQQQLADKIGYSVKSVSKWERGGGLPTIETLIDISRILHVSVEELILKRENRTFFLGIDGGGTKTALELCDEEGNVIKSLIADGCNPIDIGIEKTKKILTDAIYEVCGDIPFSSVVTFAGIAGGISAGMKEVLCEFFSEFNFKAVENDSDNRNIIAAGLAEADGITLILGTGICAFLQKDKKRKIAGGKGYLIDNGGSAYNIGRDGLNAYFCEKDGISEKTLITAEIEKIYGENPQDVLKLIYSGGKKTIASFSKTVYEAAKNGDEIALLVLKQNMEEAAFLVNGLAEQIDEEKIPLVISGGLTKEKMTLDILTEALGNPTKFSIKVLDKEPVEGAVMLARKLKPTRQ